MQCILSLSFTLCVLMYIYFEPYSVYIELHIVRIDIYIYIERERERESEREREGEGEREPYGPVKRS